MGIYSEKFIYNGKHCNLFNLMMCTFESNSGVEDATAGGTLEFSTVKQSGGSRWETTSIDLSEPLEFSFQVYKTNKEEFSDIEKRTIHRWLVRKDEYKELQFEGSDVIFYSLNNIKWLAVGGQYVGMEISCKTREPWALSRPITKTFTVNGASNIMIMDNTDEDGYTLPKTTITVTQNGAVSILNNFDGHLVTINNCVIGEVITIDSLKREISSSISTHSLPDDFNFNYPRLRRLEDNVINNLTLTGNFTMNMTWQEDRKVGV